MRRGQTGVGGTRSRAHYCYYFSNVGRRCLFFLSLFLRFILYTQILCLLSWPSLLFIWGEETLRARRETIWCDDTTQAWECIKCAAASTTDAHSDGHERTDRRDHRVFGSNFCSFLFQNTSFRLLSSVVSTFSSSIHTHIRSTYEIYVYTRGMRLTSSCFHHEDTTVFKKEMKKLFFQTTGFW